MPLIDLNGLGYFKGKENAMIAGAYSATKTYDVGDYCYYSGTLYRCTTAITTAEAWTSGHWTAAKLAEDLTLQSEKIDYTSNGGLIRSYSPSNPSGLFTINKKKYWNTSGTAANANSNCCTNKISGLDGIAVKFSVQSPYLLAFRYWNPDGTYNLGRAGEYVSESIEYVEPGAKIAFNFAKVPSATMTDDDKAAIEGSFKIFASPMFNHYLADSYDSTATYSIGDIVLLGDRLYKCISNITTPEVWTNSHWKSIRLDDELKTLNSNELKNGFVFRMGSNPDSIPIGSSAVGYSAFISQTWDTFLTDYSGEVAKSTIGTSSTTTSITTEYNIYKYVFTPRDYEKTVILTAGCHGDEYEGFWGLYRLMRMIYDEGYKYPDLRNLRHKVRFVVVPVWNPWGLENKQRNCPLGFPPNENLNASVTVDSTTYPAFTSKEAKAIKDLLDSYEGITSFWCDFHTDPFSSVSGDKKGCYGYALANSPQNKALYALTVDFHNIIKDECNYTTNITIYNTDSSATSGVVGYGIVRNVPTAILEVSIDEFEESGTAQIMKYAQEWYGNGIANMISSL